VNGPVLVLPAAKTSAFITNGMTPIPGLGTLFPHFRGIGEWGTVDAVSLVVRDDDRALILAAPRSVDVRSAAGDGWTVALAERWKTAKGPREGDYQAVPDAAATLREMMRAVNAGDAGAYAGLYADDAVADDLMLPAQYAGKQELKAWLPRTQFVANCSKLVNNHPDGSGNRHVYSSS
jgi:hypothetical protein